MPGGGLEESLTMRWSSVEDGVEAVGQVSRQN